MKPFALEAGESGETVVLVHGFAGSHAIWRYVIPQLSPHLKVIAYDLPGHGDSHPWPDTVSPRHAAKALLTDLRERGVERFHLAGHSMGGAISVLMAMAEPGPIASMTLLAPGGMGPEINARLLRRFAAAKTESDIRTCLEAMTGWDTPVDQDTVSAEAAIRAKEGQNAAFEALAEAITRDGKQGAIPGDALASLEMPVSVVWGTIDNVLPAAHLRDLPPRFAQHRLDHVGHMLPAEVPDFVASVIARNARAP